MSFFDNMPDEFKYLMGEEALPEKELKKEIYLGKGMDFGKNKDDIRITIPDSNRSGHFWCFGTTRVGKTRLLENMVEEDIKKGYDVIVLDPKGDAELFSKIAQVALLTGRKKDLMLFHPVFPDYSVKINPLEYYSMVDELVGHIMAAVPDGKEPFFKNVAYETSINVITAIIQVAKLTNNSEVITFQNLIDSSTDKMGLEELLALLTSLKRGDQDTETQEIIDSLSKVAASEKDYFSKISSSLRVALMELTMGNTGKLLGRVRGNEVIRRLEANAYETLYDEDGKREGVIFVVQAGSLLTDRTARTIGKVIISSVAKLAGRIFASGRKLSRPLCVYIDEAQSMLYGGIDDVFAKAGGANVWLHCFSQSINQIYNEMPSKDAGKAILDNTNTKIFMRAPDQETADSVAKFFGEVKKFSPIFSPNTSNLTVKESLESLITPQHILELQPRQFFATSYNGMYRGEVRKVSDLFLKVAYPKSVNKSQPIPIQQ